MRILSIETSCDETAIAIVDCVGEFSQATFTILANKTVSQIDIHKEYGGVFPMLAKREHAKALVPLLVAVLKDAGLYRMTSRHVLEHPLREEFQHILEREPQLYANFIETIPHIDTPVFDAIAVTTGPGLEPALWVGINFAKALSLIWKKPVISVNHMEGHLLSSLLLSDRGEVALPQIEFPALGLLISGGHTELILMHKWGNYEILGETRDDAVGEAFDKVARLLGLPYPGGPHVSEIAKSGTPGFYPLPRPMLNSGDYSFSFAGIKTAVRYLVASLGELTDTMKANIAREFEDACIQVLVTKTLRAVEEFAVQTIVVGGGVSANAHLRLTLQNDVRRGYPDVALYLPNLSLSTDNALMIAIAGYLKEASATTEVSTLKARGRWEIE